MVSGGGAIGACFDLEEDNRDIGVALDGLDEDGDQVYYI